MPHFTFASGVRTRTVSVCCPWCRQRRILSGFMLDQDLYCSLACQECHTAALVRDVARVWPIFASSSAEDLDFLMEGIIPDAIALRLQGVGIA